MPRTRKIRAMKKVLQAIPLVSQPFNAKTISDVTGIRASVVSKLLDRVEFLEKRPVVRSSARQYRSEYVVKYEN